MNCGNGVPQGTGGTLGGGAIAFAGRHVLAGRGARRRDRGVSPGALHAHALRTQLLPVGARLLQGARRVPRAVPARGRGAARGREGEPRVGDEGVCDVQRADPQRAGDAAQGERARAGRRRERAPTAAWPGGSVCGCFCVGISIDIC